jgi:hypothetical protein
MTGSGQTRPFGDVGSTSGLPPNDAAQWFERAMIKED